MANVRSADAFLGAVLALALISAALISCGPSQADSGSSENVPVQTSDDSSLRGVDDLTARASEWAVITIESKRRHDYTWMAQERPGGGFEPDEFALIGPFRCYAYVGADEALEIDEDELFYLVVNGRHAFGFVSGSPEGTRSGETGGGLYTNLSSMIEEYGMLTDDGAGCFMVDWSAGQADGESDYPLVLVGVADGQCVVAREPFRRWDEPSEALLDDIRAVWGKGEVDLRHERFPLDVSDEYLIGN